MSLRRPTLLLLCLPLLLLAACGDVEDTRPGQPVKHRQEAFKAILRAFEPMGTMLKDKRYDADKFAALANELAARSDAPWPYFGADTNYPPSKSKPEVWQRGAEFEQAQKDFLGATAALVEAARHKDAQQVEAPYKKVYETCQSCHRTFRER